MPGHFAMSHEAQYALEVWDGEQFRREGELFNSYGKADEAMNRHIHSMPKCPCRIVRIPVITEYSGNGDDRPTNTLLRTHILVLYYRARKESEMAKGLTMGQAVMLLMMAGVLYFAVSVALDSYREHRAEEEVAAMLNSPAVIEQQVAGVNESIHQICLAKGYTEAQCVKNGF